MWSRPRRRNDSSHACMIQRREPPRRLGSRPWGKKHFVATMAWSRRSPTARPRISSLSPSPYPSAVSKRLMPASIERWTMRTHSSASRLPPRPNIIVPRAMAPTCTPERPSVRYSMRPLLRTLAPTCGCAGGHPALHSGVDSPPEALMALPGIDLLDLDRFQKLQHHEMFKKLRAEDPVSWHDLPGGKGFWNVVRHADLIAINRDTATYSSEAGGVSILDPGEFGEQGGVDPRGVMMLYMDPPKHTRYRLLVNKGFTPRMIGLLEKYLKHRAVLIVDNIIERGSCDFVEDLASELPLQAIAEIMGVPQEDRKLLFDWSNRMIGVDDPEYAKGDDGMNASMELYMYVNELAKKRKTDPRDDIVTKLINAEVDGDRLSEIEFDMFMMLLTVAGNETTRNTTAWGMWALMENPQQYKELKIG